MSYAYFDIQPSPDNYDSPSKILELRVFNIHIKEKCPLNQELTTYNKYYKSKLKKNEFSFVVVSCISGEYYNEGNQLIVSVIANYC